LAEFFARKFSQNGFDKQEQKWFNDGVPNQHQSRNCCTIEVLHILRKKKDTSKWDIPKTTK
jgi:hypothetical protein